MGFTRPNPPCRNCDDRHEACHSKCPKYKEWKKEYQKREACIRKIYDAESEATDYKMSEVAKHKGKFYR